MHNYTSAEFFNPSKEAASASTLIDLLQMRARCQPDHLAYIFLADAGQEETRLTYAELDRRAKAIACALALARARNRLALLLYPPGLDFIEAFFGCLYAGVAAVPAYPPDPARVNRTLPRLEAILADCQAALVLSTSTVLATTKKLLAQPAALRWLATDEISSDEEQRWSRPVVEGSALALLQYTSGSTGTPRGVMLSHANLLENASLIDAAFKHAPEDKYLSWLPTFHDMGFMAGVLQPLFAGVQAVLMSPASFLQRPLRWLEAISRHKATISGGPNFSFDLCLRKISPADISSLDLSSWSVAFNGSEPVRPDTLENFAAAFAPCGFRREAFYPCYGLAEATLIVSGGGRFCAPGIIDVDAQELEENNRAVASTKGRKIKRLVSCGSPLPGQRVLVVDPQSFALRSPDQAGEIWVSGPSVAAGYWNRIEESKRAFEARVSDTGEGPFLRTGDLGFLRDGELFITGRLKDLIIIRGLNHYPQDIELTVERCHAACRQGCGAAFSIDAMGEERLVIVQEIERAKPVDLDAVMESIREAVARERELQVYAIALIEPGTIPKTSSGKIQRHACRALFAGENLNAMAEWRADVAAEAEPLISSITSSSLASIRSHLASVVAEKLRVSLTSIDVNRSIARYGIDSLMAIELAHALEQTTGARLPAATFLEGKSITQIAAQAFEQLRGGDESKDQPDSKGSPDSIKTALDEFPLSQGQLGLWFLDQLSPESPAYNIARAARIRSKLDIAALRRAFQSLTDRHACLRASFSIRDGEPVQRIKKNLEACFQLQDASAGSEEALSARLADEACRPFDLEKGPLLRVLVFARSTDETVLLLVAHHIVTDFWSLAVMLQEVGKFYAAATDSSTDSTTDSSPPELSALEAEYSDFVRWQAEMLSSCEGERLRQFWSKELSGELPVLSLPADRPRPPAQTFRGASHPFAFSAQTSRDLKAISERSRVTLYAACLAAFQALLYRYTDQEDFALGSPMACREKAEWRNVVGYFVNAVVLRARLSESATFEDLIAQAHATALRAFEHQSYPFPLLVELLQPKRDPSRSPLFQVMFIFQKSHLPDQRALPLFALGETGAQLSLGGLAVESLALEQRAAQFDITLMIADAGESLAATFEYSTDLFDRETIRRFARHFETLLQAAAANPRQPISRLPLLTEAEMNQLLAECNFNQWPVIGGQWSGEAEMNQSLAECNRARSDYATTRCVHELFEDQVERSPLAIAAEFEGERVSYQELNRRANKLAHRLKENGAGPETIVGVCLDRSLEMIAALLAALKAGSAFLPFDPAYPQERLAFMLEDSRARILLTQERLMPGLPECEARMVCLDKDQSEIESRSERNPAACASADNLAYVIYTSGSTGKPKGVGVAHRSVTNFLSSMRDRIGIAAEDVLIAATAISFDIAFLELFLPLTCGARVAIVDRETARDPARLIEKLDSAGATAMQATPASWRLLFEAGWQGKQSLKALCGGEALDESLADKLLKSARRVWNLYGPTETTIWSTACEVTRGEPLSIGRPVANNRAYILDRSMQPVPVGVTGEIYIAGDGLARGYLNRPDLTAEKFLPDSVSGAAGERLYRTGDLGRRRADGQIEFGGRIDNQIKVRGFRIEPEEIISVLRLHPAVRDAAVCARKDSRSESRLVCYVVTEPGRAVDLDDLRAALKRKLPDFMIPAAFVFLDSLPLTLNGKLNRNALPEADASVFDSQEKYEAPRTRVEKILAGIWADALGVERVGINDNFFEIGGDSITSVRVIARAGKAGVTLTARQMFMHPTVAELARVAGFAADAIARHTPSEFPLVRIDQKKLDEMAEAGGDIEDVYPLSPMQQGMLFHSLFEPDSGVYCSQLICRMKGPLDVSAYASAWQSVIEAEPVLRTSFHWEAVTEPVQIVNKSVKVALRREDWTAGDQKQSRLEHYLRAERARGFDLRQSPLMRLALLNTAEQEHCFVWTCHHLLIDGWSLPIIFKRVFELYNSGRASSEQEKNASFKDYILWLQRQDISRAESFWRERLKGFTAPTRISVDKNPNARIPTARIPNVKNSNDPANQNHDYGEQSIRLDEATTRALQSFCRRHGLTLSTLAQGAWALLLGRYSGEQEVLFGVTSSGRPATLPGAEAIIGPFINTLPARVRVRRGQAATAWLRNLQDELAEARQYEYSPLAQVQAWSDVRRGAALFETIFVFENYPLDPSLIEQARGLEISDIRSIEQTNYPLTVAAVPGAELALHIAYKTARFDSDTIARMLGHLRSLLEAIQANPNGPITALPMLSEAERRFLLEACNDTQTDYSKDRCLNEMFEEQVEHAPDAIAVVFERERLTYRELDRRANRLARYLRAAGVGAQSRVGLCVERSLEMVAGFLAILKAGAAYVPIDSDYPKQRLGFIIRDANIEILLTQSRLAQNLPSHEAKTVFLDAQWDDISQSSAEKLPRIAGADHLAYLIYTSGSTGEPKAAMVSHRAACNHVQWLARQYPLSQSDCGLQKYSIGFDTSVAEIFYPLVCGAALIVARQGGQQDVDYLFDLIQQQRVSVIDVVPSMLKAMIESERISQCRSLRRVLCGGEEMDAKLAARVYERLPNVELANLYGPTEAAIGSTFFNCEPGLDRHRVPIGRPISNTQVYILTDELEPSPIAVAGEIFIGGDGLAWGYLNRPDITAESFIPDPFSGEPGARLYRTGDLGRFLPDGNIEFLGRVDHQVKVRGFRIEPAEIEVGLLKHPSVKEAVAAAFGETSKRIVAYVVFDEGSNESASELRKFLSEELPAHAIPAAFIFLDKMPLTATGKIDRRALPAPDSARPETEREYVAPRNEVETALADIWAQSLGVDRVGIDDNFFALGGDSIISLQIIARASRAGLSLTPKQIFQRPTIAELAEIAGAVEATQAEQETVTGRLPLTPVQRWFFERDFAEPHHYNQAVMLELKQAVDVDALKAALDCIIAHHDALRLRFIKDGARYEQINAASEPHNFFARIRLSHFSEKEQSAAIEGAARVAQASLDLREGPLLRAVYFDLGAQRPHLLLLVVHHLAVDAVSWRIIVEDLQTACEQSSRGERCALPPKTTSFKRWAERLSRHAQTEAAAQELDYWVSHQFEEARHVPVDYAGGTNAEASAQSVIVRLEPRETRTLLQEATAAYSAQINDLLLTALIQTFAEWTAERSLLIDLEGHGREEIFDGVDLSRTVGWFTTIFPVLLRLEGSGIRDALKGVKEQLRRIPNRGIGYGLLKYLGEGEAAERLKSQPQPQVSFNYLGQLDQSLERSSLFSLAGESAGPPRSERAMRTHLLEIEASVLNGRLQVEWAYSEQAHSRATIERRAKTFINKLRLLIEHCASDDAREYAPSDFPLARIAQQKLDEIAKAGGDIEDIYPLSPMQQGMLFHSLFDAQSDVYCAQLICRVKGQIDPAAYSRAWQLVIESEPMLRTGFEWEGVAAPLQVVRRTARLVVEQDDWRAIAESQQQERLKQYALRERSRGFDLSKSPLMRMALIKTAEREQWIVWSCHHLIIDGWSQQLIIKNALTFYDRLSRGERVEPEPKRPYKDYIAWLMRQDASKARSFWRERLKGFTAPTRLPAERGEPVANSETNHKEQRALLSKSATAQLQSLARSLRLTLNTILQGAWAILLSAGSGDEDVVFGVVASGRSAEIAGIDSMAGLFINTLPARGQVTADEELLAWLNRAQARQAEMAQYEHTPLAEAQALSDVPRGVPLFESLFVFENYPIDATVEAWLNRRAGDLEVSDIQSFERSNYPLTFTAIPGEQLSLNIAYDSERFADEGPAAMLASFQVLIESIAANPQQRVSDLRLLAEAEMRRATSAKASRARKDAPLASGRDHTKSESAKPESAKPENAKTESAKPESAFVAPSGAVEEALARMWAETLGIERVGAHDNFFDLGGRPLSAAQLLHRVREALRVEMALSSLIESPTVSQFSKAVIAGEKTPGQTEKIARLLNRIEAMSSEDVKNTVREKERAEDERSNRTAGRK